MISLSLNAMATTFEVALHGDDPARLRAAGEEALREIERLDRQLSFYDPNSEISRVNARAAREPVKVDPRVFRLLKRCIEISRLTSGVFDINIVPFLRLWGFTGDGGRVPSSVDLDHAKVNAGIQYVKLNDEEYTVRFKKKGVSIDLGAVAKGYAIEQAVEILRECGVTSGLIHGGTSTVYGLGSPPDQDAWRVAIRNPADEAHPVEVVDLVDCALSVSAVHGKSFREGGIEYGHIIDPRTGQAVAGTRLAAVIGPSPTDSDALSTALLVLGRDWLPLLQQRFPGYRGIVVNEVNHA